MTQLQNKNSLILKYNLIEKVHLYFLYLIQGGALNIRPSPTQL